MHQAKQKQAELGQVDPRQGGEGIRRAQQGPVTKRASEDTALKADEALDESTLEIKIISQTLAS